ENEKHEKLRLEREQEQKKASVQRRHPPLVSTPGLGKEAPLVAPVIHRPPGPLLPDVKVPTPPSGSPKPLPHYASPVLAISQHHMVQQPIQPQPLQPHHVAPQPLSVKLASSEDTKPNEQKKRPGGVGTREVHNKLEKNRRAHLKECFETLKRNIPNVDDKKTSNLSVLRSALRYIQVEPSILMFDFVPLSSPPRCVGDVEPLLSPSSQVL
ncbi:hypothetical protein lerEdw1_001797, partial [Lerista edwardsae]